MTTDRKCPVCSGTEHVLWGQVAAFSIIRCTTCGLGMTDPFPTDEELSRVNKEMYQAEQRGATYLKNKNYFTRRYKKNLRNIKEYTSTGKLLDVGCNIGFFLKVARDEGFETTGVELNKESAAYGREQFGLDIRSDYLENIAFKEGRFDVVTLFDVLEHVPDMTSFLKEVHRLLKPGGLLTVQLPNIASLMADLTRSHWSWLTPPDHLYHFTPETVTRLLEQHGFVVRHLRTWEPAREFSSNWLSALRQQGKIGKLIQKLLRELRLVHIPVLLCQRLWWNRNKGGLIELYAERV